MGIPIYPGLNPSILLTLILLLFLGSMTIPTHGYLGSIRFPSPRHSCSVSKFRCIYLPACPCLYLLSPHWHRPSPGHRVCHLITVMLLGWPSVFALHSRQGRLDSTHLISSAPSCPQDNTVLFSGTHTDVSGLHRYYWFTHL